MQKTNTNIVRKKSAIDEGVQDISLLSSFALQLQIMKPFRKPRKEIALWSESWYSKSLVLHGPAAMILPKDQQNSKAYKTGQQLPMPLWS